MEYKTIYLRKGREQALLRKHPWIFSGALFKVDSTIKDGEKVLVADFKEKVLATGHYADASIAVRILSFGEEIINHDFYLKRFKKALSLRNNTLRLPSESTDCYRLISGEGDDLPGLIIDIYGQHAVIQCHSKGMLEDVEIIAESLKTLLGESPVKADNPASKNDHKGLLSIFLKAIQIKNQHYESRFLLGNSSETIAHENGNKFYVNWEEGQKTGFFLDQRENRKLLGTLCEGRTVLNTFCYTGGFSVYALKNNAKKVTSIDISLPAMETTDRNIALNECGLDKHESITGNVMEFLKDLPADQYDLIILDPPAFAKNKNKSHNAMQAYKRLNLSAMKKIRSGGIIFSFSCSQVIDRYLFENTVRSAAIESNRDVKFTHFLTQAPDHVNNAFHQEGHYLKGLVYVVH